MGRRDRLRIFSTNWYHIWSMDADSLANSDRHTKSEGHIKISILYNKNKETIGNLQTNHQAETQQCRQNEASGPHTTQGYWWE